ncbi:MAG: primosomal protein N', partial [Leptolyngbyaceae cyanobacterium bins.59]|nr:primosomal protein N' [Leptolyngbyaceae cyanobacterium bins.59]
MTGDIGTALVTELGTAYPAHPDQPCWVEALVDCPGTQGLYTYAIPPDLTVRPGDILSVPFGAQQVGAIAIRLLPQLPDTLTTTTIREIEGILTQGLFSPRYWELLNRVAQYYQTSLMDVIRVALPPGLLQRSQRRVRLISESDRPPSLLALAELTTLSPVAQQVVQVLQRSKGGSLTWHYLLQQIPGASRGLRELQRLGWVESYLEPPTAVRPRLRQAVTLIPDAFSDSGLTPRQREILEVLKRQGGDLWLTELLQLCRTS